MAVRGLSDKPKKQSPKHMTLRHSDTFSRLHTRMLFVVTAPAVRRILREEAKANGEKK